MVAQMQSFPQVESELRAACKNCGFVLNGTGKDADGVQQVRIVNLKQLLPKLDEVTQARRRLRELCLGYDPEASSEDWLEQLDTTQWMVILSRTLRVATDIAFDLRRDLGSALMLSEGIDCDWNCVICSLVHLLLFPRYRSIEGLKELVVREWALAQHPFSFRLELAQETGGERTGPLFALFLDCVQQLWSQFPHCFSFSSDFLIVLHDLSHAGLFREFLVHLDVHSGALSPSVFNLDSLLSADGRVLVENPVFGLAVEMARSKAREPPSALEPSLESQLVAAAGKRDAALEPDVEVRFLRLWRENYLRALPFLDVRQSGRAAELWRYRELLHLVRARERGKSASEDVQLRNDSGQLRLPSGCDFESITAFFPFSKEAATSGAQSRTTYYPGRGVSHFDMSGDTLMM